MLRNPLDRNRRPQPNPEGIARAVRGLDRLVADPLAWRWRDGAYQDYVGAQFSRAYGTGPAARDETGKLLPADPILTEIEPYRPQARPEDSTPAQPVGPDRPNRPGDVLGLQKALSAAGRYAFDIAGGERAGAYSGALRSAIEEFLAHPYVQEIEFAEYVEKVRHYLRDNGAMRAVGETIDGFVAPIKITEPGLIAAAHRWGVGNTRRYLDAVRKKDWDSEAAVIGSPLETEFRAIEYRLRLFQDIPLEPGASSDIPSAVPTP